MDNKLVATTLRLERPIFDAIGKMADAAGQEPADYAAGVLTLHAMKLLKTDNPKAARRLEAELALKAKAVSLAQKLVSENGFDPNVTLKVFQAIKANEDLNRTYLCAVGDRPGDERGNPIKARINRSLGAAIKTAVRANPQTIDGNPVKVQVSNEYIFSYTLLEKAPAAA
ncbi:hypothetical protein [Mesorhizobium caraganae]|uniref:hypothetical protein n=1 Tax=Mesorhizobium caraganae TaxID=483206 RepID=UPI001785BBC2|nr:hypothetical protein [Mesorhizobium caraganae]